MKVTVDQNVINEALSYVSRIVTTRPSYPVLSNILIDAKKAGAIHLSSTNLDLTLTVQCGAEVKDPGIITAPAKTLSDFVSFLPDGTVTLETEKDKLTVSSASHNATFSTIPVEEFPELPETSVDQKPVMTISGKIFKEVVDKVSFACAKDLSRPIFSAVLVEPAQELMNWVGLDGHRMSKYIVEVKFEKDAEKLLIPADAMEEVARSVGEDDEVMMFTVKKGQQVVMKYGTIELAARQVEGVFPDYKVAMPKDEKTELVLNTEEFLNAVKMARLFSSEETANRVELEYAENAIKIGSSGSKVGENETVLPVKGDGESFKAAFNAQFLTDILTRIQSEKVKFSTFVPATDEKLRGGVFREIKNEDYFHIVMPLFTS